MIVPHLSEQRREKGYIVATVYSGGRVNKSWCKAFSSLLVHYLLSVFTVTAACLLAWATDRTTILVSKTAPKSLSWAHTCIPGFSYALIGLLKKILSIIFVNQVEGKFEMHKFPVICWIHWGLEQGYQRCFADVTIRGYIMFAMLVTCLHNWLKEEL